MAGKRAARGRSEMDVSTKGDHMKLLKVSTYVLGAVVAIPMFAQTPQPGQSSQQSNQQNGQSSQLPGAATSSMPGGDSSMSGSAGVDTQAVKDKMFVRKATEGGYAMTQLGQLAQQKSSTTDVKTFGQRLVDDHATFNKELMRVADQMGVRAPSKLDKDNKAEFDKLSALSGPDFDKEFLIYMMTNHRKDLREYRMEETATTDPALKDVVTDGEKVIAGHMREAYTLAKASGIAVQPRPGGPPAAPPK